MPTDLRLAIVQDDEALFDDQPLFRSCVFHEDHHRDNLAIYADHVWCYACDTYMRAETFAAKFLPDGERELAFTKTLERSAKYQHKGAVRSRTHLASLAASSEVLLWRTPHAVEYLERRGIDEATAKLYHLGHTGFAYVLPILDAAGNVLSLRYRRDDKINPDGKHKYWGERGYNDLQLYPHALQGDPEAIVLTEGEFDALLLRAHGILNAYSLTNGSMGAARPEEVLPLLRGVQHLLLVGDQDTQGRKTGVTLQDALHTEMRSIWRQEWDPEWGKDITAVWQSSPDRFAFLLERIQDYLEDVTAYADRSPVSVAD